MDYPRALAAYQGGELELAEQLLRDGLAGAPDSIKHMHVLSAVLLGQGRFAEARPLAERAHLAVPHDVYARTILGKLRLATGDYPGGWPLYEARLQSQAGYVTEIPPYPPWRGEDLNGKTIVVWREQGFGDMIQCLRFLPVLRDMGARVIAVTRPALARLYARLGFEVAAHGGEPGTFVDLPTRPDVYTHPFSIPRWLGVTLPTLPAAPYLSAQPSLSGRVGVVWRGRPAHQYDRFRSLPPELGARLLSLPGAVDLEPAATGARDFLDTAAIVAGLDAVVSVDTSAAHLAGALGKPLFLLLPRFGLDWRWMEGRADSAWYSSAQLFRQPRPGDWSSVIDAATAQLPAFGIPAS